MIPAISLRLEFPRWDNLVTIPQGTLLIKGRHGHYHSIMDTLAEVPDRFGCYAWGVGEEIAYCGSFTGDHVRSGFKNNIQARVHNYWQSHSIGKRGNPNTNLMVFNGIKAALQHQAVHFWLIRFDSIHIGDESVSFKDYCQSPDLVLAVEELIIRIYKRRGECQWNRG